MSTLNMADIFPESEEQNKNQDQDCKSIFSSESISNLSKQRQELTALKAKLDKLNNLEISPKEKLTELKKLYEESKKI